MVQDLLPIELYTPVFYHVMLLVVLFAVLHSQLVEINSIFNLRFMQRMGILVFLFVLLYMGLRPINGVFVDMTTYNYIFESYQDGAPITSSNDPLFYGLSYFLAQLFNAQIYFFICALLYVLPLYFACVKWFKEFWFYGFLFFVCSFTFWAYGVNGIRNGIAGSLFLLALSRDKWLLQALFVILSIGFHKSMMLPALGYLLSRFYNKPTGYIVLWVVCILLSLVSGNFWEGIFSKLGFEDERLNYLTTAADSEVFSKTGFRWDFLLFSASAVFAGWYYIFKKRYQDEMYFRLFNTYVFANAFWILVIRANFSNRFAYLSWFIMGLIICYPLLKKDILINQYYKLGFILLGYFLFSYIMVIMLKQ